MFNLFTKKKSQKKSDFEIEEDDVDEVDSVFLNSLKVNLSRLIVYAESAEVSLQREVAEKLANEAVNSARQVQIVEYGGLTLLVPLTKSADPEVQRLAAHALANLSVNSDNQMKMANNGAIEMLVSLLDSSLDLTQRQASKALANLGVNSSNKRKIAEAGALPKLIYLSSSLNIAVRIEAIAAVANLAVNDLNELDIVRIGGLVPIIEGAGYAVENLFKSAAPKNKVDDAAKHAKNVSQCEELAAQCARALRNLSVNPLNRVEILKLGGLKYLKQLQTLPNERIMQQAHRAIKNLEPETTTEDDRVFRK